MCLKSYVDKSFIKLNKYSQSMRIAIYGSILFVYFSLSESETHSNGTCTKYKTMDNNNVMVDCFPLFVANCNVAALAEVDNDIKRIYLD